MNCLYYALDRWHAEGGYLVLRRTAHPTRLWHAPHILHVGSEGLTHYAPGATLGHPVQALVGFDGVVWDRDLADAPAVSVRGVLLSGVLAFVGALMWAARHVTRRTVARIRRVTRP